MLEYQKDWGDGTLDKYEEKRRRLFWGEWEKVNFNSAFIHGTARWRTFSKEDGRYSGPARNQPVRAALYKGTRKNPFAEFIRKVEVHTDGDGRFEINLPIRRNADKDERRFPAVYWSRKRTYLSPAQVAQGVANPGKVHTFVNAVTNYESRRSDILNWFTSDDHKQWLKNHNAGRDDINALNSLIRYATAPITGPAEGIEKAAKLYEKLTGKPLPGVTKKGADAKARRQAVQKGIWDSIRRFKLSQSPNFKP